jgi:hypothetical protein
VSTDSVSKSERISGSCIVASSHMTDRTDQNEFALVQRGDVAIVDINNIERDARSEAAAIRDTASMLRANRNTNVRTKLFYPTSLAALLAKNAKVFQERFIGKRNQVSVLCR